MKRKRFYQLILCTVFIIAILIPFLYKKAKLENVKIEKPIKTVLYSGKIYHIFFHSLIIYPKLAFRGNKNAQGFQDYMITKNEFERILPKLYENNFILIDTKLIYSTTTDGNIIKKELYLPDGKKPLIISIDDVNYQTDRDHRGFAKRIVLDTNNDVATEVITPEGKTVITRDGDVMPLLDDFVKLHPDFSYRGAKGIIAETGFDGVLGYRTNIKNYSERESDLKILKKIVGRLKETGWVFASHSYSHDNIFKNKTISLENLKFDSELWDKEVRPIIGDTDIFIGPFGQTFSYKDERRNYLVSKGFKVIFGVGMDLKLIYFKNYLFMDRADIDGIRLLKTPYYLKEYFDPIGIVDEERIIK